MESQSQTSCSSLGIHAAAHPIDRTSTLILILPAIRMGYGMLAALAVPYSQPLLVVLNLLYEFSTYLVISLLIWRERRRLLEYRISKLALILFLCGPAYYTLMALLKIVPMNPFSNVLIFTVSIVLAVKLIKDRQVEAINPEGWVRWLIAGTVIGAAGGSLVGLLISLQPEHMIDTNSILNIILQPTFQISTAGVYEEPLFRAFFWIYLYQRGWQNRWIWIFQAFLFCIAHTYYISEGNFYSLGTCLFGGLVLGLVAWKARDIAPSMFAHGFFNSFAQLIGDLAAGR